MKRLLILTTFAIGSVFATPINVNLSFTNPAWYNNGKTDPYLVGKAEDFMVKGIKVVGTYDNANNTNTNNSLTVTLDFNFGSNNGVLGPYGFATNPVTTITAADLFFRNASGTVQYGIPLVTHSSAVNSVPASSSIDAGDLYKVTNSNAIFTSDQMVAGTPVANPITQYGSGRSVWLDGSKLGTSLSNVAAGTSSITANANCTAASCVKPEFSVVISVANDADLNALIAGLSNGSLFPYFTGSTCGNDLVTGAVPEPASMALVGGAIALVALRLRKKQ